MIPLLEKLRKEGKLKKGVKQITDPSGEAYDYVGEIDDNGIACGFGTATKIDNNLGKKYTGTFLFDNFEGLGKMT